MTVGTQDIFVLHKRGQNEHCLDKIKFGKTSSTSQLREVISDTDCLQVSSENVFLSLSKHGAIYCFKVVESNSSSLEVLLKKQICFVCRHCFVLRSDFTKLKSHISKLHFGPVTCKMCDSEVSDVHSLKIHQADCSFSCGVVGCGLKHKKLREALSHKKAYLKSLK